MKQAIRSILTGLSGVAASPKLVLGLWLVNLLAALPAALVLAEMIEDSIGASLFHETVAEGFDADWWAEFDAESAEGLAETFGPGIVGAGAVYANLEAWWSGRLFEESPTSLVALGVAYAVFWAFLLGGVLDSLSRRGTGSGRPGLAGFFAAGGATLGRFLQLVAAAGILYYLVYRLSRWLFRWIEKSTRDVTVEQAVFVRVLAVAAVTVCLLHLVRILFDFAKVAVFADGVSAPRALARSFAFVARRPGRVLTVYLGLGLASLLAVALYAGLAPGAGPSGPAAVVLAFLLSQLYLVARLVLRLALLGAELDLYRSPAA